MSFFPMKILLATDTSEEARLAARMAIEQANKSGSELHVVHVGATELAGFSRGEVEAGRGRQEGQRKLDEEVKRIEDSGGTVAGAYLRTGENKAAQITALGEEIGAGLIVVGSTGMTGMRRVFLGSVSESVVRHAHCPVMVVREEQT